ncbi:hypothetical protein CKAH01_01432 [Colletotrichum kahawae]|uniref:Uncharacterized protein n=1 Tax=Colletotrichum kahawae TaxID=34407 RepID=A0AAD9Y656_COLKA|nr:hypothetical protein CKAH01_01432 [Colletotrichum kahawae]
MADSTRTDGQLISDSQPEQPKFMLQGPWIWVFVPEWAGRGSDGKWEKHGSPGAMVIVDMNKSPTAEWNSDPWCSCCQGGGDPESSQRFGVSG